MDQLAPARLLSKSVADRGLPIHVQSGGWTVGPYSGTAPATPELLAIAAVGLGLVSGLDELAEAAQRDLDARDPALMGTDYPRVLEALRAAVEGAG